MSWKKAQVCRQVPYLRFVISKGRHALSPERKQTVCSSPQPETKKEVREFRGGAGSCHIWIPGFLAQAKPLQEAGSGKDSLNWRQDQGKAFQEVRKQLASAPALVPDVRGDSTCLFMKGTARPWESSPRQWVCGSGLWPIKIPGPSDIRVATMSPGSSCHNGPDAGG